MTSIRFFEVGGAVRDSLMGLHSNDIDFAVEVSRVTDVDHAFCLSN